MTSGAPGSVRSARRRQRSGSARAPRGRHGSDSRLRAWQREALADYADAARAGPRLPGHRHPRRRQDHLRAGPGDAAAPSAGDRPGRRRRAHRPPAHAVGGRRARFGLDLDPTLSNAVGPVPRRRRRLRHHLRAGGEQARACTTRGRPPGARLVSSTRSTTRATGCPGARRSARRSAAPCGGCRLTGTPFRTQADEQIPFVRYTDDGRRRAAQRRRRQLRLPRGAARRRGAAGGVRRVHRRRALARRRAGEVVAASLTEDCTRSVEAAAWKTALDPKRQVGPARARRARRPHRRTAHRWHARRRRAGARQRPGGRPRLRRHRAPHHRRRARAHRVRRPAGSERLSPFASSDERIAVCVRMVSEGVDIPRVAALAWLTSYRTPLFFAQAVGRVVRSRGRTSRRRCSCRRCVRCSPSRPSWSRNATTCWRSRPGRDRRPRRALRGRRMVRERTTAPWRVRGPRGRGGVRPRPARRPRGGGRPTCRAPDDDEDFVGLPGLLSPEQTAALLARRDVDVRQARGRRPPRPVRRADAGRPPPAQASWRAAGELRREVNRLVGAYAARIGGNHAAGARRDPPRGSRTAVGLRDGRRPRGPARSPAGDGRPLTGVSSRSGSGRSAPRCSAGRSTSAAATRCRARPRSC